MNKIIITLIIGALLIVGVVVYTLNSNNSSKYEAETEAVTDTTQTPEAVTEEIEVSDEEEEVSRDPETVIGQSINGNDIVAYHYGEGEKELLLVGGIHGAYSANTSLLMNELMEGFTEGDLEVPDGLTVTVIPTLNPDGLESVFGTTDLSDFSVADKSAAARVPGRFNANKVDLNRNFDCEWQPDGVWQSRAVSGGDDPFSEPEAAAVRDYVEERDIAAAVVYYSAEGSVYASQCNNGTLPTTAELTAAYAAASGYAGKAEFDFYAITGDMVNWLAKEKIPAISVLLPDHESVPLPQNRAGVKAVLDYLSE